MSSIDYSYSIACSETLMHLAIFATIMQQLDVHDNYPIIVNPIYNTSPDKYCLCYGSHKKKYDMVVLNFFKKIVNNSEDTFHIEIMKNCKQ